VQSKTKLHAPHSSPSRQPSTGLVQRSCACGGTAGLIGSCAEWDKDRLRRKVDRERPGARTAMGVSAVVRDTVRSPGQPLDSTTRQYFESRVWPKELSAGINFAPSAELVVSPYDDPLEREAEWAADTIMRTETAAARTYDFSRIRIHTDAVAAESARAVESLAFTVGDHIVFADGRYSPGTTAGRRLLAHELAHTIQHRGLRTQLNGQCDPGLAGGSWSDRVAAARAMPNGNARNQCFADMIDEALPDNVTVHQSTNNLASLTAAINGGHYIEWGTLSDLHVNFDRDLHAKAGVSASQYGVTRFLTSPDGRSIEIFIVLGPRALDPVGPSHTQMAFDHESGHAWDFLSQFALMGAGPPHAATPGEELEIYTEGFSRHFLDLWTIDNAAGRFSISDTFPQLFVNFALAARAERDASFESIEMFYDVRITGIACNLMKFRIWLQMMQNQRPANDALVNRINALPGLGLNRGDRPEMHFNPGLGCN